MNVADMIAQLKQFNPDSPVSIGKGEGVDSVDLQYLVDVFDPDYAPWVPNYDMPNPDAPCVYYDADVISIVGEQRLASLFAGKKETQS